ncbi:MAG TPA: glycosyltransferase family 2 protein [Iamia sp.]|nr:glycosyltransferase family 2 protein [Iamia sp.]
MYPSISVIIPVRDRAEVVARAVRSALAQTLPPDEVIVIDDASADDTVAAVEAIDDRRVRLIRHRQRRGASAARNTGIDTADGDVLGFLDSDDEWQPGRLARQVPQAPDAGLLACGFEVRTGSTRRRAAPGCFRGRTPHRRLLALRGGPITTSCLMVDRRTPVASTRFDERLPALQDLDFAIRATDAARFSHVDEVLVTKHSGAAGRVFTTENEIAARRLLLELHARELAQDGPARGAHHLALARALAGSRQVAEVAEHLDAAAEAWPGIPSRLAQLSWRSGGVPGLRLSCKVWWFVAEDPIGRARSVTRSVLRNSDG